MRLFSQDRPRKHHYQFAHRELLTASRRFAANLRSLARSGRLDNVLVQAWSRVGEAMPADGRLPADGLAASFHSFQDRDIVLVTMPRAEHAAEAHFVAIVISGSRLTDYYVLEHGWTTEDEPRTVMCKWDEGGHVNFGDGPRAETSAFLAAVEQLLASNG
jgi:hypothetical protein